MIRGGLVWLAALSVGGCVADRAAVAQVSGSGQSDIKGLSDEFDGSSLSGWKRVSQVEGWGADQLEKMSMVGGELVLMPRTSTWYMDYRGVLIFKEVSGNFVVTAKVKATGRDGVSAPRSDYSLGGIMVRAPRSDNAGSWRPGGENYVFLSIGSADRPGNFQFEVKTTQNSKSNLEKTNASSGEALLQVARIGSTMVMLKKQDGRWSVHKRFDRGDFPQTLQVGMTVYTDYSNASKMGAKQQNGTAIQGGRPDLMARYDYMRFARPKLPAGFDARSASDGDLLKVLGDAAV